MLFKIKSDLYVLFCAVFSSLLHSIWLPRGIRGCLIWYPKHIRFLNFYWINIKQMHFRPSPICDAKQLSVAGGAFITVCWKRKLRLKEFKFFFFFFPQDYKATRSQRCRKPDTSHSISFHLPILNEVPLSCSTPNDCSHKGAHHLHSFYPWSGLWTECVYSLCWSSG